MPNAVDNVPGVNQHTVAACKTLTYELTPVDAGPCRCVYPSVRDSNGACSPSPPPSRPMLDS